MLRFKGSDYRRFSSLTWYNKMDNLLMALGFTKSKADSNLCFKVEGGILVMLLLYVDDLFLTRDDEIIVYAKRKLAMDFEMKYLGMMHYFLGMEVWQNVDGISLGQREVCSRDPEEFWDDGLQVHDHTYDIEHEAIE